MAAENLDGQRAVEGEKGRDTLRIGTHGLIPLCLSDTLPRQQSPRHLGHGANQKGKISERDG
jgi:hypothetical protein